MTDDEFLAAWANVKFDDGTRRICFTLNADNLPPTTEALKANMRAFLSAQVLPNPKTGERWTQGIDGPEMIAVEAEGLDGIPEALAAEVRHHIREMYPKVLQAAPSTFLTSVGNHVLNKARATIEAAKGDQ